MATVGKTIGCHIDDAHQERQTREFERPRAKTQAAGALVSQFRENMGHFLQSTGAGGEDKERGRQGERNRLLTRSSPLAPASHPCFPCFETGCCARRLIACCWAVT